MFCATWRDAAGPISTIFMACCGIFCSRASGRSRPKRLDEIGHVHGHLVDLCVVKLLDFPERADILGSEEVDGDALAAKAAAPTNAVNVVLAVRGQIVVD